MPGTLEVDGRPVTDQRDNDVGEFSGQTVRVRDSRLPVDGTVRVRFETEVIDGPFVENQAELRGGGVANSLSDDGGRDENSPTVVPLERPPTKNWSVTKTIVSPNDGEATVGDVIRYAITVENTGNIDLDGITLADQIPQPRMNVVNVDTGAFQIDVESIGAPAGAVDGELRFTGLSIAAGEAVRLFVELDVLTSLDKPGEACNRVVGSAPGLVY